MTLTQIVPIRRVDKPRFALGDPVLVADIAMDMLIWEPGQICGVTVEREPHYDVRLKSGEIIKSRRAKELRASQVTMGDEV